MPNKTHDALEPCPECEDRLYVRGAANDRQYRCARCGIEFDAEAAASIPPGVESLPPSRAVIYRRIAAIGPVPYAEIEPAVAYESTAIRAALRDLRESGAIEARPDPNDGRRLLYEVDG